MLNEEIAVIIGQLIIGGTENTYLLGDTLNILLRKVVGIILKDYNKKDKLG